MTRRLCTCESICAIYGYLVQHEPDGYEGAEDDAAVVHVRRRRVVEGKRQLGFRFFLEAVEHRDPTLKVPPRHPIPKRVLVYANLFEGLGFRV
jgi:hypothetical protein